MLHVARSLYINHIWFFCRHSVEVPFSDLYLDLSLSQKHTQWRPVGSQCRALKAPVWLQLTYTTTAHKLSPPSDTRPIVISGPSGVGKGTLYKMLLDRNPQTFVTSVSHTTRDPRPGETRDVDYYYVSMQEFEDLIAKDGFVEHAKFGKNRYGTSKKMIQDFMSKGKIVVLDIEMEVCFHSKRIHCCRGSITGY